MSQRLVHLKEKYYNNLLKMSTVYYITITSFIGRLEFLVVSSRPDMLTMNVRDVIIGYHDDEIAYYMKTDPQHDRIMTTTVS